MESGSDVATPRQGLRYRQRCHLHLRKNIEPSSETRMEKGVELEPMSSGKLKADDQQVMMMMMRRMRMRIWPHTIQDSVPYVDA